MNVNVSEGSIGRLKRLQELKGYDEQKALDFAISLAWLITEKRKDEETLNQTLDSIKKAGDSHESI